MKSCFADTSYFLALIVPLDPMHRIAREWAAKNRSLIITTGYVLLEVGNFVSPVPTRSLFSKLFQALREDARTHLISASPDLLEKGANLYSSRKDKNWSLTDCISFVVMKERGLHDALTADHHFEQAGFRAVLKVE